MRKDMRAFICASIIIVALGTGVTFVGTSQDDVQPGDGYTQCSVCHNSEGGTADCQSCHNAQSSDPAMPAPAEVAMGAECSSCHNSVQNPDPSVAMHVTIPYISHANLLSADIVKSSSTCAQCHKASTTQATMVLDPPTWLSPDLPALSVDQGFTVTSSLAAANGIVFNDPAAKVSVELQKSVTNRVDMSGSCVACHNNGANTQAGNWQTIQTGQVNNGVVSFTNVNEQLPGTYVYRLHYAGTSGTKETWSGLFSVTFVLQKQYVLNEIDNAQSYVPQVAFKQPTMQGAMLNKLNDLDQTVTAENYADAIAKLQHDIIPKVDGSSTQTWVKPGTEQGILLLRLNTLLSDLKELQSS